MSQEDNRTRLADLPPGYSLMQKGDHVGVGRVSNDGGIEWLFEAAQSEGGIEALEKLANVFLEAQGLSPEEIDGVSVPLMRKTGESEPEQESA